MPSPENPIFDDIKAQLATGKVSFEDAVSSRLGTDEKQIVSFLQQTSIYDLISHFSAAGESGKRLLDLSNDVASLRRGRQKKSYGDALHRIGSVMGCTIVAQNPPPEEDLMVEKFFSVLKDLKAEGAQASGKLVASWISEDLTKTRCTTTGRNAIRTRLMRHEFDL